MTIPGVSEKKQSKITDLEMKNEDFIKHMKLGEKKLKLNDLVHSTVSMILKDKEKK